MSYMVRGQVALGGEEDEKEAAGTAFIAFPRWNTHNNTTYIV